MKKEAAGRLIDAREIAPVAQVMPSEGLWGLGSGYVQHTETDYERWIIDEIPAALPWSRAVSATRSFHVRRSWSAMQAVGLERLARGA